MANKQSSDNESAKKDKRVSEVPKHSLEQAIRIANALEEKNGGNPLPPMDVAFAIDMSPGSSSFRDLLSSSIKYGLTSGSYNQARVSLESLGRDVVEPKSPEDRRRALNDAAFRPDALRRVFEAYRGKKMPDPEFFRNAVSRDFGIPKDQAAAFVQVFEANVSFLGLVKPGSTGKWLSSEVPPTLEPRTQGPVPQDADNEGPRNEFPPERALAAPELHERKTQKQAIFVGHGKNKVPLQQLEKILTEYKIPYKVAIDEPNKGRPISQKVTEIMNECGSAVIIFTADEEFRDKDGNTIYRPSENAIFELGAASALYGSRIVIFRQAEVHFPANFRDIGHITFDGDNLSAKATDLFRELIGFGLIRITVGA